MPSKLEQLQLQFRQRLKEEQMIKIHTDNQQKALSKVSRYNGLHTTHSTITTTKPQSVIQPPQPHYSPIKKGSPGVDRSRPLPPISKDSPRNTSSSRSSPISENTSKTTVDSNIRSKSVDLDTRYSVGKPSHNGNSFPRNGLIKLKTKDFAPSEKKPDADLMSRLKQAELQRLKSKVREEPSPRNVSVSNGAISRSSIEQKKRATKSPVPTKPNPKAQNTSITNRRTVPSTAPKVGGAPRTSNGSDAAIARKPPGPGQEQCNICGRNFNQDRIQKHASICKKASQKKVKVFDVTKMRVKGTEAEQFVKKGLPKLEPKAKKSDWRKKHSDFIEAIRQAKMVQQHLAKGGKVSDLPPPPPSDTSDYVPCPHCGRKFNEGVAERHIPKCKNILSNKKNVPSRKK